MYCIDKIELERYLQGNIEPDRMLAIDAHICECEKCKSVINSLSALKSTGSNLGAELLTLRDCPEYEDLSALVDGTLKSDQLKSVQAHANSCELCSNDIAYIQQLRSHAALREKISVKPGMTRRAATKPFSIWKWVSAGASIAIIAAVAITLGNPNSTPNQHKVIAKINPPANTAVEKEHTNTTPSVANKPNIPSGAVANNTNQPSSAGPEYASVLRDGRYKVIKVDGKLALAKKDGTLAGSTLEAQIEASIAQKLKTGKVKPPKQVMLALNTTKLRANGEYTPPPTAPKLIAPIGKIVMSDTPSFTWSKVDLAESYRIKVIDEAGNPVFEGVTQKNSLTLSKHLQRGRTYIWQVGVRFGADDQWANSYATRFVVLSEECYASIRNVKRQLPGSHIALGVAYESAGLYDEAAWEYRALRRDNPDSKLAYKLLSNVAKH